jgi:hypothetical protein
MLARVEKDAHVVTPALIASAALFGALGLALGFAHFRGLRHSARALLEDGVRARSIALHGARILATAIVFVVIARRGALPILAAFAGFIVAERIVVAHARRSA